MPCSIEVKGLKKRDVRGFTERVIRSVNSLDSKPNKKYKRGRLK